MQNIKIGNKEEAMMAITYLENKGFAIDLRTRIIILESVNKISCIYGDKFSKTISFLCK